jgi:hypothetical protein
MPNVEVAHVLAGRTLMATIVQHIGVAVVSAGPLVVILPRGNLHNAQMGMHRLLRAEFIVEIAALTRESAGFTPQLCLDLAHALNGAMPWPLSLGICALVGPAAEVQDIRAHICVEMVWRRAREIEESAGDWAAAVGTLVPIVSFTKGLNAFGGAAF